MTSVRPKKHLGQHFLKDENIAAKIAASVLPGEFDVILEIGPGMGVLTKHLLKSPFDVWVVEIDQESVAYLKQHYPQLQQKIIEGDFLTLPLEQLFKSPVAIAGNFPYNISSQILFKMLEHRVMVPQLVGMFQKEVAERVAAPPGSKTYGILSVLLQAFYSIEYLFTVSETVFNPPPKVKSGVIRLLRRENIDLPCDEKLFFKVVKTAFNQRRKTLRNALKPLTGQAAFESEFLQRRAETLSVDDFVKLTLQIEKL